MTEQLKPCPFCGGDDVGIEHIGGEDWAAIVVQCRGCQAQGGMGWMERETGETYDEMISRITDEANVSWETRADDARIFALMQTIESQNQTAKAVAKRLEEQDAEIERHRARLIAARGMESVLDLVRLDLVRLDLVRYNFMSEVIKKQAEKALAAWRKAGEE